MGQGATGGRELHGRGGAEGGGWGSSDGLRAGRWWLLRPKVEVEVQWEHLVALAFGRVRVNLKNF